MSSAARIVQRWDETIADILARFDSLLHEASVGSDPLIAAVQLELTPLTQPWMAVEHQKHQYVEEVDDTWNDISDELCDVDDLDDAVMDREGNKRDQTNCEIEIRYQRAYVDVMSQAAEKMRREALAVDARSYQCTQCGAPMDKITLVSQALNVACGYCTAINTIEPTHALRMFAASGSRFLGEKEAFAAWTDMLRAETQINAYRNKKDVPLDLLERYAASARQYWTTRLRIEAEYVPEEEKYLETRLERYIKDAERMLRQHWQWRRRSC